MKPEFKVQVYHKGMEYSFNGGPKKKAELYPAIVDVWVPVGECESVRFRTGRKEWLLTVERLRKPRGGKRG